MKLIPDAKRIALKAYSMWANYLGLVALIAPVALFYFFELDTNPILWWMVGVGLIIFGSIGRLIDQHKNNSPLAIVALAFLLASTQIPQQAKSYTLSEFDAVAVPLVARWEGLRTTAYLDTIASPPVWTVCYGETRGVKRGDRYTEAECKQMLSREIRVFRTGLHNYFTQETKTYRLTPERDAAYTSLAYNAGVRAIGKSTATRRLNAGDIRGGCKAIGWWNKAGKYVVRGLVNRRADETRLCLKGLD